MRKTTVTCDRCSRDVDTGYLELSIDGYRKLHTCSICTPLLVEFFEAAGRSYADGLGSLTRHQHVERLEIAKDNDTIAERNGGLQISSDGGRLPRVIQSIDVIGDLDGWEICDVSVGNRRQFSPDGPRSNAEWMAQFSNMSKADAVMPRMKVAIVLIRVGDPIQVSKAPAFEITFLRSGFADLADAEDKL